MTLKGSTAPGAPLSSTPPASGVATLHDLPQHNSTLTPDLVSAALDRLSLKGKLPGYEPVGKTGFKVALFGEPFDRDLIAQIAALPTGCIVTYHTRVRTKLPTIVALILIVSIWPGVLLMDSFIPASWGWWPTWMWYYPFTIVQIPLFLPRMWRKSRAAAQDHLQEQLSRIAGAIHVSAHHRKTPQQHTNPISKP